MNIFNSYSEDGFYWFRLFGLGFVLKDINKHPLIFSERYGYVKKLVIGHWLIKFLPRRTIR